LIKVARLIPFFSGQYGGPVKHILELTKHLSVYPIKTVVYACSEIDQAAKFRTLPYQQVNKNFEIKRYNSYLRFRDYRISLKLFPSLYKDSKEIDIFHSHGFRSFQEDIGASISFLKKKKFVITPHGALCININYFHHLYKRFYDFLGTNLKNKFLDIDYIAVSKTEIEFLRKYEIDGDKIHYIPHGINTNVFKPVDNSEIINRFNLHNLHDKKIVLYVGRMAKRKGIDILIKSFALVQDEIPNAFLLIVGGDYGYGSAIQKFARSQSFQDKIKLLGFIPRKLLPQIYSLADVVVYPSKFEIFGHVILEANACEKPVIASDHWGPKELIRNGKNGFVVKYGNIYQLKEKIIQILNNETLKNKMGKQARMVVENDYSWKKNALSHYQLYKRILK